MGLARKAAIGSLRVLLLLALLLGAGWFIVSLTYDDEQPRMQANEGVDAVQDTMAFVQQTYMEKRRLPTDAELAAVSFRHEPHVRAVRLDSDGSFLVVYQGRREIDGKTLRLTSYLDKRGAVRWRCSLPEIDPRWWPDYCRQRPDP
jgi:pilin